MYWIIGADKQEYGPADEEELRQWIYQNRANSKTSVRLDGEEEWHLLSDFDEFSEDLLNSMFEREEKNLGFYHMEFGELLGRSWDMLMSNFALLAGASFLVWIINYSISFVPVIGTPVSLVLYGPLYGGLYALFLKVKRGKQAVLEDAFGGFGPVFIQLALTPIVSGLLAALSGIVAIIAMVLYAQGVISNILFVPMFGLGLIPSVYLTVCWAFALPLVIDRRMDFLDAMKLSFRKVNDRWFHVCFVLIGVWLVAFIGFLFCLVGAVITVPLGIGMFVLVYEEVFKHE
ncbi:MAG: GYF domain-containing protein [Verrucomicrobia bacterium]|nr:GYF domain-containing protein [Verrucomicrobiota bacterium]